MSKYCCYIPKSSQINRNKYFQFTQWKKYWLKNVFIFLSHYLFIAILCAKMSRVNKALRNLRTNMFSWIIKCKKMQSEKAFFFNMKHIWPKISFVFDIARKRKVKICRISLTCLPICGFQDMFLFPHLFEKKSSDSAQFVVTQRKLKTTLGDILKWRHPRNEWHPCVNFINVLRARFLY